MPRTLAHAAGGALLAASKGEASDGVAMGGRELVTYAIFPLRVIAGGGPAPAAQEQALIERARQP